MKQYLKGNELKNALDNYILIMQDNYYGNSFNFKKYINGDINVTQVSLEYLLKNCNLLLKHLIIDIEHSIKKANFNSIGTTKKETELLITSLKKAIFDYRFNDFIYNKCLSDNYKDIEFIYNLEKEKHEKIKQIENDYDENISNLMYENKITKTDVKKFTKQINFVLEKNLPLSIINNCLSINKDEEIIDVGDDSCKLNGILSFNECLYNYILHDYIKECDMEDTNLYRIDDIFITLTTHSKYELKEDNIKIEVKRFLYEDEVIYPSKDISYTIPITAKDYITKKSLKDEMKELFYKKDKIKRKTKIKIL